MTNIANKKSFYRFKKGTAVTVDNKLYCVVEETTTADGTQLMYGLKEVGKTGKDAYKEVYEHQPEQYFG